MLSRSKFFFLAVVLLGVSLVSAEAAANTPRPLGVFGAWQAFSYDEDGGKVCYMASKPTSAKGNYSSRGEIFAIITHRPGEGTRNVFSYITGYPYRAGSDVTVKIGSSNFLLFTQDDTAWAPDAETDNKITDAIRRGSNMVVTGTSARGTLTTDTFSLSGSGAAHDAITKECGL